MSTLRVCAIALVLLAGLAEAAPRRFIYAGPHPTASGLCEIEGAHTHGYAPDATRYAVVDGQWIYQGGVERDERPRAAPRRDRSERKRDRASSCPFHAN
jgi:hypothetical protein